MKNFVFMCLGGAITVLAVIFGWAFLFDKTASSSPQISQETVSQEPDILYWVAPMDANFRRDKPGQSPMGMDLVPVYAKENADITKGVVEISAAVGNNLGVKAIAVEWSLPTLNFISSGQVNYAKESLVHLHARTSGWVEKLYVRDMGQQVKKGQALYGIYSLEFINAKKDYLRALNAQDGNLVRAAKNRLKALRIDNKVIAELKQSKKVSPITIFYAPQNGYIEQLNINEGMYVNPENKLLTIADLNQLTVDVELDHQYAAWLSQFPGPIEWTLTSQLMPTQSWQGKLDYIYPMLNEKLRTMRVRLLVNNNDQLLKPNMWLNLKGHITATEKTLLIPRQALIRTEDKTRVVMALGEGRFKSVGVKTGRFFNQKVEVLDGLQVGDRIVTSAQFLIDSESNIDSDLQRMESSNMDSSDMGTLNMENNDDN
jgi:Cu(I)/Ag(I) efflux system membrane fusion protein